MKFATEIQTSGFDPVQDAKLLAEALADTSVVKVNPTTSLEGLSNEELRSYFDDLAESLGTPVPAGEAYDDGGAPTGERWQEIRYIDEVPDMDAFRHSKNAQPLHNDESYVSTSSGIMLFYCQHQASEGGETYFVDGNALVSDLDAKNPELLQRLTTIPVIYSKAGDSKSRPIIEVRPDGTADVNFNYYCVDSGQDADAIAVNQEFLDYLENSIDPSLIFVAAMKPGEAAAWRDDRVLHGRRSFTANKTNDRLIWKTGIVLS